jgi:hypothetical protein
MVEVRTRRGPASRLKAAQKKIGVVEEVDFGLLEGLDVCCASPSYLWNVRDA